MHLTSYIEVWYVNQKIIHDLSFRTAKSFYKIYPPIFSPLILTCHVMEISIRGIRDTMESHIGS